MSGEGIALLNGNGAIAARVNGTPQDLKLTRDRTRLLAAMNAGGLFELDPKTLAKRMELQLDGGVRALALRRDERIVFAAAANAAAEYNYVMNVSDFRIVARLPRPRVTLRTEAGAAWKWGGRRLFVAYVTLGGSVCRGLPGSKLTRRFVTISAPPEKRWSAARLPAGAASN